MSPLLVLVHAGFWICFKLGHQTFAVGFPIILIIGLTLGHHLNGATFLFVGDVARRFLFEQLLGFAV